MKNVAKKLKGKKVLSLLLAMVMMLSVASPAFSPVMGIIAKAADGDTVELAFNNIFVLEAWANNSLSSKVISNGVPQDSGLDVDLQNGSFTLTKTVAEGNELYTAFSMSTTNAGQNTQYYMMDIEPNTTYTFSYNVTGNIYVFTPYVFFFDDEGLFIENGLVAYSTPGYGYNEFSFTTPAKAESMQLRWTIGDNSTTGNTTATTVTATVTDVAIFETEIKNQYLSSKNIFKIEEWASNTNSSTTPSSGLGTVTPNVSDGSISFVNSGTGYLWTGFGIDQENSNDAYYTMTVSPNTSYTLTYDLTDQNLLGPIYCQPYIVEMRENGTCITYYPNQTASLTNKFQFTTQAETVRIQLVFALITDADNTASADSPRYVTVSNIGIYETSVFTADFETFAGYPHRLTYTEGAGNYTTLPTPTNIPAGKFFAGWYTGKNGSGEAITADTEISYKSFTVYPYYQAKVDSISVKTLPSKTAYTLGEKVNPAGLVLTATQTYTVDITDEEGNVTGTETKTNTFDITSGYTIEPEYLTATGTQTITVSYGGQTATFTVEVSEYNEKTISVNSADLVARVANNVYTLDYTAPEAFSRYELIYYSDSYVKGTITMADGTYEEFFLEPSTKGSFASYIDDYLTGGTYADIQSIGFECLDKEFGNFELYSVDTIYVEKPADTMAYYENTSYKAGINLAWGGVLAYLQDKENAPVAATYSDGITKVNYSSQLPSGSTSQSNTVNLINTYDKGRYVQQSYYGTREEPYVLGDYNGVEWNYNPVQGGNILGESSKVVDYRITDTEIYVKTRPLEWAKWSDEAGQKYNDEQPDDSLDKELIYEDSYNAWAYMESWYVFEDGMLKTYCRYVDYSGYPSATTTQEFPAFYCVEPLNNFVYYAGGEAWDDATNTVQWASDLDFWGASSEYNEMLIANGLEAVDPYFNCNENWAAFMGGATNADYGIGIYTADVTDFVAGSFQTKYQENQTTLIPQETSMRHADTTDPATENPTSYISPIDTMELESYKEYTYSYYITTGTQEQIREDFRMAKEQDEAEAASGTKIAVPETVYMQPVGSPDATTTVGQYYVNNVLDANNYYNVETVANAADNMYFGVYSGGAKQYKISVTNATNASDDIILGNADGTGNVEDTWYTVDETGHVIRDEVFSMRFANTGLKSGEIATAKWEITVEYEDGTTKTHTAYTVLYAPELTVGAVAESRYDSAANTEISSWITGANGVDHSQRAPLGSFHGDKRNSGYFREDPLVYPDTIPSGGSSETSSDYILGYGTQDADDYTDTSYVMQTATNGSDGSRSQSYLGLLTVDKSRYTNTEQIPNLKMGYDVLRVGSAETDSLAKYTTYYTLGTADSYTSTSLSEAPSGWTVGYTGDYLAEGNASFTDRRTVTPSYSVSDIDGKYIHAVNQAMTESMNILDWIGSTYQRYATAGTSLLCSVTDKSGLRDSVLEGYNISKGDYSEDSYNKMVEKLQPAATVLGDPSATQEEIDNAQKELDDTLDGLTNVFYSLKYDNLFSAYEFSQHTGNMTASQADYTTVGYDSGVITVINEAMTAGETYTKYGTTSDYYRITLAPNTEYVFEYDVTTSLKAQAFMFFYDASGANGDVPTSMSIKTNNGSWSAKSESNPWFGNYTNSAGTYHYAIKFTTGANTTQAGFRFGNTSSEAVTSSFSNIKLVDAAHYYEDATYSATEAVYKENASYGTMATATRPGYTFTGWKDTAGNTVTGADIATEHKSIYSQWSENTYTINYNANGGTGSVSSQTQKYTANATLASSGFTRTGYTLIGWSTDDNAATAQYSLGQSVSKLSENASGTVTLYAVWRANDVNVTFDNLVDMLAWEKLTASNATASDFTGSGFTLTSNSNVGEGTFSSPYFDVEPGKQYKVDMDFEGDGWDVYIFFCDESGTWIDFADGTNRFSSDGGGNQTRVFTAPDQTSVVKAQIRVDANEASNTVKFSNIRVYEVGTVEEGVSYETPKTVTNGKAYGELPVPTRYGYNFTGWTNAAGETVSAETIVNSEKTVNLYSGWSIKDPQLAADTVVIDFGLPVKINVLANDINMSGGTLTAIGTGVLSNTELDTGAYGSTCLTGKADTITLANGTAAIDGTDIVYRPNGTNYTSEIVFYYEYQRANGDFYYTTVTVIPATSVYFEETMFTFTDSVVTVDGEEIEYKWQDAGTSVGERFQSDDRPGSFTIDDADDVYGTDSAYNDNTTYSMGSAKFITVDQNSNKADPLATASFTFTGTGFDLFTATDNKAGLLTVSIYKDGTRVKGLAVNTYYGYTYDETANDGQGGYVASTEDNALFQVPAIRARDLDWGTYTVVVEPKYSYPFDVNLNKEYRVYVDSVRIYDPMGPDNATANNAYLADGEYAPDYLRLRDTIVTKDANGEYNVSTYDNSALFFDGYNPDLNNVTDVVKNGPKNEVYLAKGQAVAFNISATSTLNIASVQLGMKLINNGGDAQVTVMNTQEQQPTEITLTSATEQFYKLDSAIVWDDAQLEQNKFETAYPIVILNSSENDVVISLTSLKWAFEDAGSDISTFSIIGDQQTLALAPAAIERALTSSAVDPVAPENVAIDSPETIYLEDGKGAFIITTEAEITKVTVNGVELTDCEINEDGQKTWKYSFEAEETGENVFEIVVYDDEGNQSETITNTINVVDDGSDVGDGSLTDGIFANDWIKMIFELIRKILELLGGALA